MNKDVIFGFIASIFAIMGFSEARIMENCKIELIAGRFQWIDERGTAISLEDQEEKLGIPTGLKLPTTPEEMRSFYEIYARSSSAQLAYCTNFWLIQKKSALDLFFKFTSVPDVSSWLKTVREFVRLVKESPNIVFKMRILRSYFEIWAETVKELETCIDPREVLAPIQEIKEGLRNLLAEVNQEKKLVQGIDL